MLLFCFLESSDGALLSPYFETELEATEWARINLDPEDDARLISVGDDYDED